MGRWTWWVIAIAVAYFLFYLGGSYSFRYTHACAHSHRKVAILQTEHTLKPHTSIVCDRYSGNAKRWSFGDPVRAVVSKRLIKWDGMAIGLIVVVIAAAMFLERLRKKDRRRDSRIEAASYARLMGRHPPEKTG
jgi:hypothetical protein